MIGAIEKGALAVAAIAMISDEIGRAGDPAVADDVVKSIAAILDTYYQGLRGRIVRGEA